MRFSWSSPTEFVFEEKVPEEPWSQRVWSCQGSTSIDGVLIARPRITKRWKSYCPLATDLGTDMKDKGNYWDLLSNYHEPGNLPSPERQSNVVMMRMSFGFRQSWVPVLVSLLTSCVTWEVCSISVMSKAMATTSTLRNAYSDPPLLHFRSIIKSNAQQNYLSL